eukprot:TRINITY_DN3706_c0_g1_i4.p1 TRINITY_DN3706_c0_g1~~TRINITY_DN3706_c0_g1_i4.p1  ORF type:complete len:549 (+),score=148.95 TRINITY_DN3706_c0_g1_i4:955-2601(+)
MDAPHDQNEDHTTKVGSPTQGPAPEWTGHEETEDENKSQLVGVDFSSTDDDVSPSIIQSHVARLLAFMLDRDLKDQQSQDPMWDPSKNLVKDLDFSFIELDAEHKDILLDEITEENINRQFNEKSIFLIAKALQSYLETFPNSTLGGVFDWQEWAHWEELMQQLGITTDDWKRLGKKILRTSQGIEIARLQEQQHHHLPDHHLVHGNHHPDDPNIQDHNHQVHSLSHLPLTTGEHGHVDPDMSGRGIKLELPEGVDDETGDMVGVDTVGMGGDLIRKRKREDLDMGDDGIVEEEGRILEKQARAAAGDVGSSPHGYANAVMNSPYDIARMQSMQVSTRAMMGQGMGQGMHQMSPTMIGAPGTPGIPNANIVAVVAASQARVGGKMDNPDIYNTWSTAKDQADKNKQMLELQMMEKSYRESVGMIQKPGSPTSPKSPRRKSGGGNPNKRQRTSTPRKRSDGNFGLSDVTELLTLPQSEAAKRLNMSNATFSKRFRIVQGQEERRWPYRQLQVIEKQLKDALELGNQDSVRILQERKTKLLAQAFILVKK